MDLPNMNAGGLCLQGWTLTHCGSSSCELITNKGIKDQIKDLGALVFLNVRV